MSKVIEDFVSKVNQEVAENGFAAVPTKDFLQVLKEAKYEISGESISEPSLLKQLQILKVGNTVKEFSVDLLETIGSTYPGFSAGDFMVATMEGLSEVMSALIGEHLTPIRFALDCADCCFGYFRDYITPAPHLCHCQPRPASTFYPIPPVSVAYAPDITIRCSEVHDCAGHFCIDCPAFPYSLGFKEILTEIKEGEL